MVTSIADSFSHTNDAYALSVREAVDLSNAALGAEEIWLPGWDFVLTRDRDTFGFGTTDLTAEFGDLDVNGSLTVRGVSNLTNVAWKVGVVDSVFDLLGDFNQDGQTTQDVDGSDFLTWQRQFGSGSVDPSNWELFSADGDDDGDVDGDDLDVWISHYGNTLDLHNV